MNRGDAYAWLDATVQPSTPPLLTETQINDCIDASLIVDREGRPPTHDSYEETVDVNHAVALAFEAKATAAITSDVGGLESYTSEGTAFKRRPGPSYAAFMALADRYRAKSAQAGGITVIELAPDAHLTNPRSAFGGVTTNAD